MTMLHVRALYQCFMSCLYAACPRPCCLSIMLVPLHVYSTCQWGISILPVHALSPCLHTGCPCCLSILLIHAVFPCCMSFPCLCCMPMLQSVLSSHVSRLHVHVTWTRTCCTIINMIMQISFYYFLNKKSKFLSFPPKCSCIFAHFAKLLPFFRKFCEIFTSEIWWKFRKIQGMKISRKFPISRNWVSYFRGQPTKNWFISWVRIGTWGCLCQCVGWSVRWVGVWDYELLYICSNTHFFHPLGSEMGIIVLLTHEIR